MTDKNHECDKQVIDICNENAQRAVFERAKGSMEALRRQQRELTERSEEEAAEYYSFSSFCAGLACAGAGVSFCEVLLLTDGIGTLRGTILMLLLTAGFTIAAIRNRRKADRIMEALHG